MKKLIVFYAPVQMAWRVTYQKLEGFEKAVLTREIRKFYTLVQESIERSDKKQIAKKQKVWDKVKLVLDNLLVKKIGVGNYFKSAAIRQPVIWCLDTLLCNLQRKRLIRKGNKIEDFFFAGCSFGEYWAVTFGQLYLKENWELSDIIYMTYRHGAMMDEVMKSDIYCKATFPTEKLVELSENYSSLCEGLRWGWQRHKWGWLILNKGTVYLFGRQSDFECMKAEPYVRITKSVPFHSKYLMDMSKEFIAEFPKLKGINVSNAIITNKISKDISEILMQNIYMPTDEKKLLIEISIANGIEQLWRQTKDKEWWQIDL